MLYMRTDSARYIAEFKDRFTNFAQKAPILVSFVLSDDKVVVIHENSSTSYDFEWDFTIPVKSFIHEIKQVLSDNHYPRLEKVIRELVPLTTEELSELASNGTPINELPNSKERVTKILYRVDKVIALKDILIIIDEKTRQAFRYKMNNSSIFFLKRYRTGKFASIEDAGNFFFEKSELLGELTNKE